jgi:RhtB (resistance to homoserine/threonine) family protein
VLDQLLVIIGITVLVMISPGPDMIIVLRNTMLGGRTGGLRTSAGVLTGNLVHISYCIVGIGWLISKSIVAFSVLRYAGAAYLVYLGISSLLENRTRLDFESPDAADSNRGWFLQGFINNVLNPKGTLFYLGVFTMVITPDTTVPVTVLLVAVMMAISTGFWLLFVLTLDHPTVRQFIDRSQRTVNRLFGVLLVSLGLRVALIDR